MSSASLMSNVRLAMCTVPLRLAGLYIAALSGYSSPSDQYTNGALGLTGLKVDRESMHTIVENSRQQSCRMRDQ